MSLIAVFSVILVCIVRVSSECGKDEFPCFNGQCISKGSWCDGKIDCKDKTDELLCKTDPEKKDPNNCDENSSLFKCYDGRCIPIQGRCDGLSSCTDASDEISCDNFVNNYKSLRERKNSKHRHSRLVMDDSSSFAPLHYQDFRPQLESARKWLLSQKDEDYGWGDKTTRAVIAFYLSKSKSNLKTEEEILIDKQLSIDISIALTRNETTHFSISELALYINAINSACMNPRNFFDYDLVSILRERVDTSFSAREFVNPYVLMTLCINNLTKFSDINFLQHAIRSRNVDNKIDILALAVLASTCIIKEPIYSHPQFRRNIISQLLDTIEAIGLPRNIYEISLLVQALNEAKVDLSLWDRKSAIAFILSKQDKDGSFGDILATYYTIPLLSGRSFLSLTDHCTKESLNGASSVDPTQNTQKHKIDIIYSLHFGYPVEMTQKIILQVAEGTNFLDIMKLAEEVNHNFRFSLVYSKDVPHVYSIGGIPNDAERGLYWTLSFANGTNYISYHKDIRNHVPRAGEETIFSLMPNYLYSSG